MDFDALLKQQQAWLDRAGEALKRSGPSVAATELSQLRKSRIEGMNAAVERLTRQRNETVRRLDAAIAEERTALKRLEEELARETKATGAAKSPKATATRAAKAPPRKSK